MAARRIDVLSSHVRNTNATVSLAAGSPSEYRAALLRCREELRAFIHKESCHPIMIRLAWHDSGTFDKQGGDFPHCGGANGSIRFDAELKHGANAGLKKAIGFLKPFKDRYPILSWADIIQMASAQAVELTGGPVIPMRYGRLDTATEQECPREGNLPGAAAPFGDGSKDAASHLRKVFHRMGFDDREIVALSGAHTLGRAFKDRSGTVQEGYGDRNATQYTNSSHIARADNAPGVGMPGGRSWTEKWLSFDNTYYQQHRRPAGAQQGLLWLETDRALQNDPGFSPHYHRYATDQAAFFAEYAQVHKKLSELGSKFEPSQGIVL
eukprot:TRINITY_DN22769_c0_g1_i1.p1 TRINITY_DN22769_c0_g1~~TRINITY_DN22769_c0_g1_i1.p1  ORF type:complete len:350 (+),score=90.65 TRINITY_DN22769_c0_g1_i1:81-1052(+)